MVWNIIHMYSYYRQRRAAPLKMYWNSFLCVNAFPHLVYDSLPLLKHLCHASTCSWKQILVTVLPGICVWIDFLQLLELWTKNHRQGMHSLLNFRLVKKQNHWFWYVHEIFHALPKRTRKECCTTQNL